MFEFAHQQALDLVVELGAAGAICQEACVNAPQSLQIGPVLQKQSVICDLQVLEYRVQRLVLQFGIDEVVDLGDGEGDVVELAIVQTLAEAQNGVLVVN